MFFTHYYIMMFTEMFSTAGKVSPEHPLFSMKFFWAGSCGKMWRFSDISEIDSVPIFRVLLVVW